jgi:hypothetical protein
MSNFLTRKFLSRRTVLRGVGVGVALPLLDAMLPAGVALAKTAAAPRPRMAFVYFPHGSVMDQWTPKAEGVHFDLPPILEPLEPFRKQLTIVSGLENKSAVAAPVHALTPGTWLSCAPYGGITIDQIAAKHLSRDTPLPSLEVATEVQGGGGCGFGSTISFRTPSTPLPMEHDPRKLFQKLFGQGGAESILDTVSCDTKDLERRLGARDRVRLDDYLTAVREIERRVQTLSGSFDEDLNLRFDMMALAFQANLTRVATFMMAAEVSHQPYMHIGIPDAFHPLSHHANVPAKLERLSKVQIYHTKVFAKFVQTLAQTNDGEASMLDNSIILYGSNMSNSNLHDHFPLPTAIVGGGCGRITGNQHLRYPDRTPIANMHVALLNRVGIATETFGDSTGQFTEI